MPSIDEVVIGIDAGTTSAKLVAMDPTGTIVARAESDPIPTDSPEPGASVQRADDIWAAVVAACREGLGALPKGSRPRAAALAAQSGSVVAETGEAITWMDRRSGPLVAAWDRPTVDRIRGLSGWRPSPGLGLSTIAWLLSTARGHADQRWGSVDDHLVGRLSDEWVTNPSNASGMQMMDVSSLDWSAELCAIAGLRPDVLAPIRRSGEPLGTISPEAAAVTGLPEAMQLVTGGHDQACAALGLGVTEPGTALLSMGTAWVLTLVTDQADIGSVPASFNLSPHVVDGRWSVSENLGGLGAALAVAVAAVDTGDLDERLGPVGSDLDDPYFIPSTRDPERAGWGRFTTPGPPPDAISRLHAVMEACAFEARRSVDAAAAVSPLKRLTVIGGGTRSRHLLQLIADLLAIPLEVRPDASWPAIGAARLAAHACGWPTRSDPSLPGAVVNPGSGGDTTNEPRYAAYRSLTTGARP